MLWWLVQNTVLSALLAGVVALICRLADLRPAVRHALWLIVLIKLVTPPLVQWPWPPPDVWRHTQVETSPTAAKPSGDNLPTWELTEQSTSFEVSRGDDPPVQQEMSPEPAVPEESREPFLFVDQPPESGRVPVQVQIDASPGETIPSKPLLAAPDWLEGLTAIAFWSWLAGAIVMAMVQVIRILRFRRLLAHGMPAPQWLWSQVEELAHGLGVRPPNVLVLPGIASPMLWTVGRPALLWPKPLLEQLPPCSRRAVLVHELAHLRRRDHWVGWLQLLAACLWWWNPLFWHVRRQLHENAELACDAWVVWTLPDDRRAYAEALIEVAQVLSRAAPAPALGIGGGPHQAFERRLVMIMRERVPCHVPLRWLVIVGLLALIALPSWSSGQPASPGVPESDSTKAKSEPAAPAPALGKPAPGPATPTPPSISDASSRQDTGITPAATASPASPPGPSTSLGSESAPSPTAGPPPDRERRLLELENKLDALLKEVRTLRAGSGSSAAIRTRLSTTYQGQSLFHPSPPGTAGVVTLTRATYKLPKEKAEALAAFLRDHVKAHVMETKADGESLIVTTTPEVQRTVSEFIGLLQDKGKPPTPAARQ